MRQRPLIDGIVAGVALSLLLPIVGSIVAAIFFSDARFQQLPIHSLVEAAGGLMALAIAGILIAERTRKPEAGHFTWMATALIGMGMLDLFHAAVLPGNQFVWLHSTATFVGGVCFACVWLPKTIARGRLAYWLPGGMLVATLLFGGWSCVTNVIPSMASESGEFTIPARALNIGGGIGFLIAGTFFVRRFHLHQSRTDWLFATHTILFGFAGVLFELSAMWDAAWWWWHALRLIAYLAALTFAVRAYLDADRTVLALNRDLRDLNQRLDRTAEERTEKLRASEERYALAVRGSTDGLWDWNVTTNEVVYAARFKELLGYEDAEFPNVFDSFESHLHPEDREPTLTAVCRHLTDREPYDVEYRLKAKSGEYRWFRARGQAIWNEAGQATRMAGSITDITARKRAEASLQHERFLFHTLMEHLPDVIYFKDVEGRFMRVTSALAERLGVPDAQAVIGKTDADFFPGEYAEQARADEQHLMKTGQPMIGKQEQPHWADEGDSWVSTTKVPLRDEQGKIIGTFGISHDITAHKQAEQRFRGVIDSAPNAMVVVSSEGRIRLVNAATESMFGYDREELIDNRVEMLVPERHRQSHVSHRQAYLLHPVSRTIGSGRELMGRRKDGSEFPVEIGLSGLTLDGRTVVLASIHDLTTRKQAERALVSAKEAAESANQAKSDFLANMSHEIRTPMNAVIGMTELVLETELKPTQRDYLMIVQESAESLLSIINQILDFSKIEAGRLELESLDFDLYEELGDALKSLGHRAHAKQLELAWRVEQDVPRFLTGDAMRLRQVLVNLVGNAIKFTEQGEVVVDASLQSVEDGRVTLHFTVRDTGIGIPEDKQKQVFAAFEQADSSTTRQFGGTGLGLAICARIVEAMNGRMWLDSEVGLGSKFHFRVDFKLGTEPPETTATHDFDDVSIVIVDDNETNRQVLKELVQGWGLHALLADSGHQAREMLDACRGQGSITPVLLSDVQMPSMDGFTLARDLRSDPQLKDTAIILLTSGGKPGDAARCEELNISSYLMKPVKHAELLDAILQATGQAESPDGGKARRSEQAVVPRLKVLLVEDGKANQVLATGLLKKWGHEVVVAENGLASVELATAEDFDLVLMDVQMPVMDGLEATARIRQHEAEHGGHLPIVAMTARAMKGDRERCLEAGMDDYVAKPVRQQELYAALSRFFPTVQHDLAIEKSNLNDADQDKSSRQQLIDWEVALESVAGAADTLREVASVATEEFPDLREQLNHAISQQDLVTARRIAHIIRSSARIFGAVDVLDVATQAEESAEHEQVPTLTAAVDRLNELLPRMEREIKTYLARAGASNEPLGITPR